MSDFTVVQLLNQPTPVIITGGYVPRGAYAAGTDYAVGDSVDYLGSSYVMYVDAAAGTLPTDTTKWQVIANKGDTGGTGTLEDLGGATKALDNLASVAINTSLISDADSTDDLGSTTKQWANVHTDRLVSTISDLVIENDLSDGDITFKVNDGGVDKTVMTLDGATGNVGIGTTAPVSELHVVATTFPRGVFSSANNLGWLGFFASEAFGSALYSQPGAPFRIGTATSNLGAGWNETFRVQSTGEVGIGTTTPGARIDLGTVAQGADTPFRYLRGYSPTSNWPIALSAIYDATSGDQYISMNGWMDGGTKAAPTFFGSPRGGSFIRDFRGTSFDGLEIGFYPSGAGQSATRTIAIASSGVTGIVSTTATTNALRNVLTLGANVTAAGVGAAGLGAAVLFTAESTTTVDSDMAQIGALWTTATHATRASALTFSTLTAGGSLTERMRIDGAGNVGIGTTAPGTKLDVLGQSRIAGSGSFMTKDANASLSIQRSDSPFNYLEILNSGGAGKGAFFGLNGNDFELFSYQGGSTKFFTGLTGGAATERMTITNAGNVGIGTTSPTNILSLGGNSARTFWLERHTTANTAGNTLTVTAGGATSGATDKAGGALILQGGLSTGSAESGVTIQGCVAGASGTTDRTQTTMMQVLGNKIGFYTQTPVARQVLATGAGRTVDDVITALQNLGLVSQS